LPFTAWNRVGLAAANRWLGWRWRRAGQAPLALGEALFPLNRARLYFAGFGRAGMAEAQWLVPHPRFEAFAAALAELVARTRPRIALIASKLFAGAADGFSFDGSGVALAIQVATPEAPGERAFLEALTELAIAHDGRPNLIKDSTLEASVARRAIYGFESARARLARHDPQRLHASELARRLAL
jgi:decaprenylphospho-beta-D-ribofuranose 2-oxidase